MSSSIIDLQKVTHINLNKDGFRLKSIALWSVEKNLNLVMFKNII
ncbi:hypothetical protein SAMN02745136_00386 [Anaerocolumna jejuensis DSM 15929]|uniref:Uncharacterized protein n=1 Tax=Anaerocolumna jejuensis DSM 15929 TaxID=1121322 RepID=A0A1M6KAY2_9FIRM|nr:hypothetical protein [Anaerocolumna jejuensis]SHJ56100.1 hypothetical protein SAMN02745136_00386 [Anaerocolumna jejuensis DSM 15929]